MKNWTIFIGGAILLLIAVSCQGVPLEKNNDEDDNQDYAYDENYDYDGEYDDEDGLNDENMDGVIEVTPKFTIDGRTITVDKGTTISLPCSVDKLPQNYVLFWKRVDPINGETIVAVDEQVITNDKRFTVAVTHHGSNPGSTLTIGLAKDEDAGQYICQLGSQDEGKIKHTVTIRVPPTVRKVPENGLVLARKGQTVSLSCEGAGSPQPTITWSRIGKKLPDGRMTLEGNRLTFENVNRKHSGTYECRANNGYGTDATERIVVDVEYVPEVEVEEVFIHAEAGNRVELVCRVHAQPSATVHWFKSGGAPMELTNDTAKFTKVNHRHILTFTKLREEDFGNYTCRARNKMGETAKVLEISGLAAFPHFESEQGGKEPNNYLLQWTVKSHTPVSEFALRVRENGETEWKRFEVHPSSENDVIWAGKHALNGLKAATRYEARVSSSNDQGWSRPSKTFHFSTLGIAPITDASRGGAETFKPTVLFLALSIMLTRCFFN